MRGWPLIQTDEAHAPELQNRFESPPAPMASKPFQNEELLCCTEFVPGNRFVVEVCGMRVGWKGSIDSLPAFVRRPWSPAGALLP